MWLVSCIFQPSFYWVCATVKYDLPFFFLITLMFLQQKCLPREEAKTIITSDHLWYMLHRTDQIKWPSKMCPSFEHVPLEFSKHKQTLTHPKHRSDGVIESFIVSHLSLQLLHFWTYFLLFKPFLGVKGQIWIKLFATVSNLTYFEFNPSKACHLQSFIVQYSLKAIMIVCDVIKLFSNPNRVDGIVPLHTMVELAFHISQRIVKRWFIFKTLQCKQTQPSTVHLEVLRLRHCFD